MEVIGLSEFRYNVVNANTSSMVVTNTEYALINNVVTMNLYQSNLSSTFTFINDKGQPVVLTDSTNILVLGKIMTELGLRAQQTVSPFDSQAFDTAALGTGGDAAIIVQVGLSSALRTINPTTKVALTTAVTELRTALATAAGASLAANVSETLVIDIGTNDAPNRITINVNLIAKEAVKPFVTEIRILDGLNYRSIPVGTKTTETYKWNEAYFTKIQVVFSEPVLVTASLQVTANGGNFVEAATSTTPRTVIDMVLSASTLFKNEFVPGVIAFAIAQNLVTDLHGNTNAAKSIDVTFSKAA
jgi:hypothetical protein